MNPTNYHRLLTQLGFSADPFDKTNADEEEKLENYFIKPPFFNAVLGDPYKPKSSIVFAPRGGGKTALKRKIEMAATSHGFLSVSYNSLSNPDAELSSIDLTFHLRHIIRLILLRLIMHIQVNGDGALSHESKETLVIFAKEYFKKEDIIALRDAIQSIKGIGDKTLEIWNKFTGPIGMALNILLTKAGLGSVEISKVNNAENGLGTPIGQLPILQKIAKEFGYSSIYILIDKIDETSITGTSSTSFIFIKPLLTNLQILETPGYAFKFFLWDLMLEDYKTFARPDRIRYHTLSWSNDQLLLMIEERLKAHSNKTVKNLTQLMGNEGIGNLDRAVIYLSGGSPRNIIRMCKEILDQQSEVAVTSTIITKDAVGRGLGTFAANHSSESNDIKVLKELKRLKRVSFTIKAVSTIFKISTQAATAKIKNWTEMGYVTSIGARKIEKSAKPSQLYAFSSPIVAMSVFNETDPFKFVANKLKVCIVNDCGTLMIRDWDDGSICACHSCHKEYDFRSDNRSNN